MNKSASTAKASDGSDGKYYYANGEKIPLSPSARFLAVKQSDASFAAGEETESVAEKLARISSQAQVMEIPEYNLSVVTLHNVPGVSFGVDPGALGSFRAAIESDPGLAAGPQVYESPATGGQIALIPVDEVIVKFKESSSPVTRREILKKYNLEVKRQDYPETGAVLAETKEGVDAIDAANALEESGVVEFAEPNFLHLSPRVANFLQSDIYGGGLAQPGPARGIVPSLFEAPADEKTFEGFPTLSATDPFFSSQWNLQKIRAPQAWDITIGNPNISIAIIDEGCDMTHEDILYKLPGYDAFAVDSNPQPNGNDAHGTACGGVAAMRMNNSRGGAGVAPGCRVMPIRIAQGIGGGFWDTTSAKVADGIRQAVDAPRSADVLSNSYGVGNSTVVTNAFVYAQTNGRGGKGCPIAAAAGNGNTPPVIYPASLSPSIPGFMAVSATNEWDQRKSTTSLDGETWWGSSYGPEVDIAAPGVHIFTSDIMGGAGYGSGNYVPNFNGTSSATPHVAGLMALVLSVDPDLRSWEVEDIIKLTADDLGPVGRDNEFGFGRINCRRALEAASRIWYEINIVPEFLGSGKECYIRANVRMYNSGINTVRLDALTLTSHNPSWTAEIDRFEYRPNPGNTLAPRTSQDVRFNRILLKANGNQSSWSYRWALNWSYTFWRPGAPVFPLSQPQDQPLGPGTRADSNTYKGGSSGGQTVTPAQADGNQSTLNGPAENDLVSIDRQSKSITILIR